MIACDPTRIFHTAVLGSKHSVVNIPRLPHVIISELVDTAYNHEDCDLCPDAGNHDRVSRRL